MDRLTLEDIQTLNAEEIIERITVVSSNYDDLKEQRKKNIREIKPLLKGYFKVDQSLMRRGQVLHVGDHFITISSLLPSSGRIFFLFHNDRKEFSISRAWLLDEPEDAFPFKHGDKVKFDDITWTVDTINPSSKMIKIDNGTTKRYIGIKRVELIDG